MDVEIFYDLKIVKIYRKVNRVLIEETLREASLKKRSGLKQWKDKSEHK